MEATQRPSAGEFALYLWRLSRPEVWYFALVPMYIGYVLASRQLLPGLPTALAFWTTAADHGATTADFVVAARAFLSESWRFWLGCLVMGPILWTATLIINDVHDLAGDRVNPRKARSPLVQGLVARRQAEWAAYAFAAAALVLAAFVGLPFLALTLGCVALAWAYSVPPIRLKTVPGADVAVNVVGAGVLTGLAGWSLAAPVTHAPYVFTPQAVLVAVAIYVPTTLVDHEADTAVGYATIATKLGRRPAFLLGWWSWVLANVGALVLSFEGWFIPHRMLPFLLIFVPVLLVEYWTLLGRAGSPAEMLRGITVCALTFLAVNAIFALMYVGWWV